MTALSLREHYASASLAAMRANPELADLPSAEAAKRAFADADAMVEAGRAAPVAAARAGKSGLLAGRMPKREG